MKRKELDRMIARYALEKGHSQEMACKMLLWRYMEKTRILIEFLKLVRKGVKTIDRLGDMLDEEQLRTLNRVIRQAEEDSWETHEEGHKEGYEEGREDGVSDFGEMERRRDILRKKGLLVVGDKPKKGSKAGT